MRIKTAHIALIISILALALSLFTAVQVSQNSDDALIDALMAQNQDLQARVDALEGLSSGEGLPATPGVTLTAEAWADGTGADVTLTLEGMADSEVLFRVMQGSSVIAEMPCLWDGTANTATIALAAGNGYTYSMVSGSEATTLASPEDPIYPELVYLSDALTAYCNLVVNGWYIRDNALTLEACYIQIQTPRLGGDLSCVQARLVLKHGDTELAAMPVSPVLDGEAGSYGCDVTDAVLAPLPQLAEGEAVDLWLEATLSDGQVLTTNAATWYAMHSGFSMAAG